MHKERYFGSDTIQTKSQEMLASVEVSQRRSAEITFRPASAALMVLDMQEYFLQESSHAYLPSAPAILPRVLKLVAAFSDTHSPVIATRHLNTPEDAGMMAKWWQDIIDEQLAYSQIVAMLNQPEIIIIDKPQYDAFLYTDLEGILRERGIEQVVICGVMTHLCCETTARSAFMRGFEVFFTIDGTATYNEQLHRASLLTLSHGFAIPVLIDDLVNQMMSNEA